MSLKSFRLFFGLVTVAAVLTGCASSQIKARKEQREKVSQSSKLYCDFVNGELFPDVDVQLNLEMAKRCDSDRSLTVTSYKTSNENMGVIYCCALREEIRSDKKVSDKPITDKKADPKKAVGADELGD
jgi:hypothetical protein